MNNTANTNQEYIQKKPMPRTDVLSYLGRGGHNGEKQTQAGIDIKAVKTATLMFAI